MIIKSSDQLPSVTLLKRFPVPRNFGVSPSSRIERGKTWPAPLARRASENSRFIAMTRSREESPYRHLRGRSRHLRTNAARCAHQDQERDQLHSHIPPFLPRGNLRFMFDEYRWHELAGLHTVHYQTRQSLRRFTLSTICLSSRTWSQTSHIFMRSTPQSNPG